MKREALVVGINQYPFLDKNLSTSARDAEAVAHLLEEYGDFQVQRLPNPEWEREGQIDVKGKEIDAKGVLQQEELETAITRLFQPKSSKAADTAVLFFAGHGLQKEGNNQTEGFLATSETRPEEDRWGISLQWLRQLLQESNVRQQIVWLDCCCSGELFNFEPTDLGEPTKGRDRFFVAAAREFQAAFEESGSYGVLTGALLQGLDPNNQPDGWVTNYTLKDFLSKQLKDAPQHPVFHNSGGEITLTGKNRVRGNICPYKALDFFDFNPEHPQKAEDPKYFYGRTALTNQLLDQVRSSNFLAVLGASGSGKSSVVRAGLLYQLYLGEKIPGSDRWKLYKPFTPGKHPLKSLAEAIGLEDSLDQGKQERICQKVESVIQNAAVERVVLVVDQFEEAFTQCEDNRERQQFFECLMSLIGAGLKDKHSNQQTTSPQNPPSSQKLCLIVVMRADFLSKCAEYEYAGLAKKIEENLVMVMPMTVDELTEAIIKPAKQVGLEIDQDLVNQMIDDVEGSPGSLPLLQYTLTELWKQRSSNRLTITDYNHLGGVEKALEKQANKVYQSLSEEEKRAAKRIFLELTRLGEGTEDTRRQVSLDELVTSEQSQEEVEQVVHRLADAKLVVTSSQTVVNIAHEALIRYWSRLRQWVDENRDAIRIERKIEAAAQEWESQGKPKDMAYLLQGTKLANAESYLTDYGHLGLLSNLAQEFIQVSKRRRKYRLWGIGAGIIIAVVAITAATTYVIYKIEERNRMARLLQGNQVKDKLSLNPVNGLVLAIETAVDKIHISSNREPRKLQPLVEAMQLSRERHLLKKHKGTVYSIAFIDGQTIVSSGGDGTVHLWDREGNSLAPPLRGHEGGIPSVAFSPDGQTIVSGGNDGTVRLWDRKGNSLAPPLRGHELGIQSVAFSPDGQTIVSGGVDGTVRLWDREGNLLKIMRGHEGGIKSVAFSLDGQTIVSGGNDGTVRLWDKHDNSSKIMRGHGGSVNSVGFSPNREIIVSGSEDKTIRLWDIESQAFNLIGSHEDSITSVAFSPNGETIVGGSVDGKVRFWDTKGNPLSPPLKVHQGAVNSVAFSPDGQTIVSGGSDGTVRFWDRYSIGQSIKSPEVNVYSLAISSDGQTIVSGSVDGTVQWWDSQGKLIGKSSKKHQGWVNSVAISDDGQTIVSGGDDGTVRLWDRQDNSIAPPLEHENVVTSVAISPDGQTIVSGDNDGTVRLWDRQGNSISPPFQGHEKAVTSVAISDNGQTIISGSTDKTVRLWDRQGNSIASPLEHENVVNSVAISDDGQTLVSGSTDKTVRLWDRQGNSIGQPFQGHENVVNSVAISPQGKYIVSGDNDGTVRLWDRQGNSIGQPFQEHHNLVVSLTFIENGKYIASGSTDGTVRLWLGIEPEILLEEACDRLRRHPILNNRKILDLEDKEKEVAKGASETCQQYFSNQ